MTRTGEHTTLTSEAVPHVALTLSADRGTGQTPLSVSASPGVTMFMRTPCALLAGAPRRREYASASWTRRSPRPCCPLPAADIFVSAEVIVLDRDFLPEIPAGDLVRNQPQPRMLAGVGPSAAATAVSSSVPSHQPADGTHRPGYPLILTRAAAAKSPGPTG